MAVLNIQTTASTGLVGINPQIIYINTNDTYATVTTTGYLTNFKQEGFSFSEQQMALVYTTDSGPVWLKVNITYSASSPKSQVITLAQPESPGDIVLPTVANHLIVSIDTDGTLGNLTGTAINDGSLQAGRSGVAGTLISFPSAASKGSLILAAVANTGNTNVTISNALHGQASVYSIPDSGAATANFILSKTTGTQHITVGSLQVDAGVISSGLSTGGQVGSFLAYPTTATSGVLALTAAVNASGNFNTTISNATAVGQSQVVSIPDSGAATANFLLTASATGKTLNYALTMPSIAFSSTSGIIGTTTNDSAAALSVGEFVSSNVASGSAIPISNNTATNVTSISLTAGDWDVWGNAVFIADTTTVTTGISCWTSTTSATQPTDGNSGGFNFIRGMTTTAGTSTAITGGIRRLSLASTTTVYLGAYTLFTTSTMTVCGFIGARRRR